MEPTINGILAAVVQAVLIVVLPILAVYLRNLLTAQMKLAEAKITEYSPDLAYELKFIAEIAVEAAEQTGAKQLIDNKKEYAIEIAEKWLETKGFAIDIDLIDAAIEQAVFGLGDREIKTNKIGEG